MEDSLRDAESETFIIPANGFKSLDFMGRFVRCFSSNGRLQISFNYGAKAYFDAGIKREIPDDAENFQSFQLFNDNAYDVEVEVGWGFGDIEDNRLSLTGTVSVLNPEGEELQVSNETLLALLQSKIGAKKPVTDLSDATIYSVTGSVSTTLVSAGANTGGILIHRAEIASGDATASLSFGGNNIMCAAGRYNSSVGLDADHAVLESYFLPAGEALALNVTSTAALSLVIYELL